MFHGQVEQLRHLALVAVALGAAAYAFVVAGASDGLPMHQADAAHEAVGVRLVVGVRRGSGERPVLDEARGVEQRRQALPCRQAPPAVRSFDDAGSRIVAATRTRLGDLAYELLFQGEPLSGLCDRENSTRGLALSGDAMSARARTSL